MLSRTPRVAALATASATTIELADVVRRRGRALHAQDVPTLGKRVRQPYRTVVALPKALP
jgi:hypothetical protein